VKARSREFHDIGGFSSLTGLDQLTSIEVIGYTNSSIDLSSIDLAWRRQLRSPSNNDSINGIKPFIIEHLVAQMDTKSPPADDKQLFSAV